MRPAALAPLVLGLAVFAGCARHAAPPPRPARYVVGTGYQAGGTWFYPREDFRYDATGLASVLPDRPGTTADNEAFDPTAMVAAHQTLQLPTIARVTNLQTGAQVLVRVNDRGPASPARLVALSPRAAALLGVTDGSPVRVQVDEAQSLALRDQLNGGPHLVVAAAPRASVTAEALPPPPGVSQSTRGGGTTALHAAEDAEPDAAPRVPDRLPEVVSHVAPMPGQLVLRAGSFGQAQYANRVAARLGAVGGRVVRERDGRTDRFLVQAGPFPTVAAADAALDRALRAGVSDARIVVE